MFVYIVLQYMYIHMYMYSTSISNTALVVPQQIRKIRSSALYSEFTFTQF